MPGLEEQLKEKLDTFGNQFEEFKRQNDAALKDRDAVNKEASENINGKMDELQEEIKNIQTALNRTQAENNGGKTEVPAYEAEHKAAFNGYMRKGTEYNEGEIFGEKAMSSDSDPDGGYLIPTETANEIVTRVFESSAIREDASQLTISTNRLEMLEDVDEADAGWVGEREEREETDTPKLNKIIIPVEEMFAQPKATQRFLDDSAVNAESWLSDHVSRKFARIEATAFVKGDGVEQPRGFLSYPATSGEDYEFGKIRQLDAAASSAGTIDDADDLVDLMYELKEAYMANAIWMMARKTERQVRKIKQDGKYIWQPDFSGKGPNTVLGHMVKRYEDMPQLSNGSLSIAFGDMRRGYQIVDRVGIRVLRDPYTTKGFVKFYTTKRTGGKVKDFDAIKLLKTGS